MNTKGFTLVELLLAVAVSLILLALIAPAYKHKQLCDSEPDNEKCAKHSASLTSGIGTSVSEECRGGVKYLISEKAITPMLNYDGKPLAC